MLRLARRLRVRLRPYRWVLSAFASVSHGAAEEDLQGEWETARGGGLSRRRASTRPVSRASPGVRGPLGGHESPLI